MRTNHQTVGEFKVDDLAINNGLAGGVVQFTTREKIFLGAGSRFAKLKQIPFFIAAARL